MRSRVRWGRRLYRDDSMVSREVKGQEVRVIVRVKAGMMILVLWTRSWLE